MTLFGRDTLITSFQDDPARAGAGGGALRALAETQADVDDPERDAEPGKIVHEIRRGKTAPIWTDRYYGTVDATPLFLVLLSELWRWSGDDAIVRELEGAARRALAWIDGSGDRDGDGFVEYCRRATHGHRQPELEGLAQLDGLPRRLARARADRARSRCRATSTTRSCASRSSRAACGATRRLAARLEREAAVLRERFDAAFWLPERGWYALGLDARQAAGRRARVEHGAPALERDRAAGAGRRGRGALDVRPLWSGWGVRTLAADEAAFDPLEYHNGTVWPHDNSLIALGLARAGRAAEARAGRARAARHRRRSSTAGCPSCSPATSADGASRRSRCRRRRARRPGRRGRRCFCCASLLELEPDIDGARLRARRADLPEWAEGLTLEGVHAHGRRWRVRVATVPQL